MQLLKITLKALLLLASVLSFGQTLEGNVVDEFNKPLAGANVYLKNTSYGSQSDFDGFFSIRAQEGKYTLVVSYTGYKTIVKQISLVNGAPLNIKLKLEQVTEALEGVFIEGKTRAQVVREKAYAVEAVDMKELKNLSTDVNAILGKVSGVNIRQSGGLGSEFNLSLNGFTGSQVRIFINGIPMSYFGSSLSLNNFPANIVESIEVYKGVVPIHLAGDALGGAVNIITNKSVKPYLDVSYSLGSFDTHRMSVNGQFRGEKSGFTTRIKSFLNDTENDYKIEVFERNPKTGKISEIPSNVRRFHDGYNSKMFWFENGFTNVSFADELMVGVLYSDNLKEVQQARNATGEASIPYGEVTESQSNVISTLSYKKSKLLNDKLSISVFSVGVFSKSIVKDVGNYRYSWDGEKTIKTDESGEIEGRKSLLTLRGKNYLLNANAEYELNSNSNLALNFSLNNYNIRGKDDFKIANNTLFKFPSDVNKNVLSLAYTTSGFKNKLKNSIFLKSYNYEINSLVTDYLGDDENFFNEKQNNLGYGITSAYTLGNLQFKASYENAIRFPDVFELYGDGLGTVPNPKLNPEKSNNFNLGCIFQNRNLEHFVSFSLNGFYRIAEDFINPRTIGVFRRFYNTQDVLGRGVDVSGSYRYNNNYIFAFNGSYLKKTDNQRWKNDKVGEENTVYGVRFPNEPYLFGNVSLSYQKEDMFKTSDRLVLTLRENYTHEFFYKWANIGKQNKAIVPEQFSTDFETVYSTKNGKYNISFGVANIFNKKLYDNLFQQKPGRSFSVKLRYFIN